MTRSKMLYSKIAQIPVSKSFVAYHVARCRGALARVHRARGAVASEMVEQLATRHFAVGVGG